MPAIVVSSNCGISNERGILSSLTPRHTMIWEATSVTIFLTHVSSLWDKWTGIAGEHSRAHVVKKEHPLDLQWSALQRVGEPGKDPGPLPCLPFFRPSRWVEALGKQDLGWAYRSPRWGRTSSFIGGTMKTFPSLPWDFLGGLKDVE